MNQSSHSETLNSGWSNLYRVGGVAALLAGALFRRNLSAEIALLGQPPPPETVEAWFALLQSHRLLGLAYLNLFDLVDYALVGLMFLALYVLLRRVSKTGMAVAAAAGFAGIVVYLASNTALSMLSLSQQYAAATADAQRTALLAAGQAVLALGRFTGPGAHPGAGGYVSLLLIAVAGMITSVVMLRSVPSRVEGLRSVPTAGEGLRSVLFGRATACVGLLAGALDLAYCLAYAVLPAVDSELLAVVFIPAAGLFWMVWHILVGRRLYRLGKGASQENAPSGRPAVEV